MEERGVEEDGGLRCTAAAQGTPGGDGDGQQGPPRPRVCMMGGDEDPRSPHPESLGGWICRCPPPGTPISGTPSGDAPTRVLLAAGPPSPLLRLWGSGMHPGPFSAQKGRVEPLWGLWVGTAGGDKTGVGDAGVRQTPPSTSSSHSSDGSRSLS